MSIRRGLLALLAQEPMYGAQLRSEFESRTGGTWPLNVGQVYTTLARLERDGMVEAAGAADDEGRINYRLTDLGATEVQRWWVAPVDRGDTPRDELVIKLALAVTVPDVDVQRIVQTQRTATLRHLQDLTKLKRATSDEAGGRGPDQRNELAWLLVLDNLVYAAEAEIRWLDHVESRLAREATRAPEALTRDTESSHGNRSTKGASR
ncbi:MAG: PadR family transcriptional regulator [Phycicoccus sp.]|nr:PadR family transcriptional regulator [Phycicoccus sp.]NMM33468.1 PadR family transcriptional regulator [Phycicoccus sp.]